MPNWANRFDPCRCATGATVFVSDPPYSGAILSDKEVVIHFPTRDSKRKWKPGDNRRKESKKGPRLLSLIGHRIYIRRATQQNGSFDGPDSFGAADLDLFTRPSAVDRRPVLPVPVRRASDRRSAAAEWRPIVNQRRR